MSLGGLMGLGVLYGIRMTWQRYRKWKNRNVPTDVTEIEMDRESADPRAGKELREP
jgi:hypothetical protein